MRAVPIPPASLGVDTVLRFTPAMCAAMKVENIDFVIRYLGSIDTSECDIILSSGLGLMVVTYAQHFDGMTTAAELRSLGLPQGTTVWLDVEGCTQTPVELVKLINAWCYAVKAAGYYPGLYVGANALLTSGELYALAAERYWHSCSRVVDRDLASAEPQCGWAMIQLTPGNTQRAGYVVDVNVTQQDYRGRAPTMAVASLPSG